MSSEVVIRAEALGKSYHIYRSPKDRLLQSLLKGRKQLYREFWALKDVSFEVAGGEMVGVIGRNGSGKSTLLQLLSGTLTPTTGSVEIRGRVAALLELGAGFNPDFTGRENVNLNAAVMGLSVEEVEDKFDAIARFAEIGDSMNQPVKTYSSGMVMRLAFAVIAHVDADILVIDEALSVGDVFFAQKCMRFLRGFRERGTVFFVSHDTSTVLNLCHRAIWLSRGEVRSIGVAKKVCEVYLTGLMEKESEPANTSTAPALDVILPQNERQDHADQRQSFINRTPYQNDIELRPFDREAADFGRGGAKVTDVAVVNLEGAALSWVVGGELVSIVIRADVVDGIETPVVGFQLKDRLGQILFGDNTYITTLERPVSAEAGDALEARFLFRMPILPSGTYTVGVAVAERENEEIVQHHWVYDALALESHASRAEVLGGHGVNGLVGVPMIEVRLAAHRGGEPS
jgi:lipopolysaccharide transport system ATP-binding protein